MPRGDGTGPTGNGPAGLGRGGCRSGAGNGMSSGQGASFRRGQRGGVSGQGNRFAAAESSVNTSEDLEEQAKQLEEKAAALRQLAQKNKQGE
jgi:hypothetical protein